MNQESKKRTYRRFIRVNGEVIASPRFSKKSDAEIWYQEMRRKKQFFKNGFVLNEERNKITFFEFASDWIKSRIKNYPEATWRSDEQRLRDYILPFFSDVPVSNITTAQVRSFLNKISEPNAVKDGFTMSDGTRNRIKALLSAMFSDALNSDPPLISINPALGIKIKTKRKGKYEPSFISDFDSCIVFLNKAKEIGWTEYAIVATFLMTGVRKQELIALTWGDLDAKERMLVVSKKYEQATGQIIKGTKGGEDSIRYIPIPSELIKILETYKSKSSFKKDSDFIFLKPSGKFFGGRDISRVIERVKKESGINISPHGLRHTFGREFAQRTGNVKALQAILGHTSSSTTDIYSDLAGGRVKSFADVMSFKNKNKAKKRSKTE